MATKAKTKPTKPKPKKTKKEKPKIKIGIRCMQCGEDIFSLYRHDFHYCSCGCVAIDGGDDYLRIVGDGGAFKIVRKNLETGKTRLSRKQIL